jgi:hypothetical protein
MTVALALFGNGSFFHSANEAIANNDMSIMNQTCQDANFPFQRIDIHSSSTFRESFIEACSYVADGESQYYSIESAGDIEIMYYNWLTLFNNTGMPSIGDKEGSPSTNAAAALDIGVYLATEAWLVQTASGSNPFGPRNIYTSVRKLQPTSLSPPVTLKRKLLTMIPITLSLDRLPFVPRARSQPRSSSASSSQCKWVVWGCWSGISTPSLRGRRN